MRIAIRPSMGGAFALSVVVTFFAACGGGGGGPTGGGRPPPARIVVSVSVEQQTVAAGATTAVTARVSNDGAGRGVTWTATCQEEPCGSVSPATTASGEAATYTAPESLPANDQTITIKATSLSDTARSGSANIAFAAIHVSIDPPEAMVDAGSSQVFTANVENDSTDGGVTWAITPESGAGTLENPAGQSVTYVAPADAPPSDVPITISATSKTDTRQIGSSSVTLPAPILVIEPTSATLDAGETQIFAASIQHDPNPAALNVTWSIRPQTGAGELSDATSTTVTYHAPQSPPLSDMAVTIVARATTPAGLSARAEATISAITMSIDPLSALVPRGTQQAVDVRLDHDAEERGVTWRLLQSGNDCAPGCGRLVTSDSYHAVFEAPAAMPAAASVTVAATSITDPTKSAHAEVEISRGLLSVVPTTLDFGAVKAVYGRKRLRTTLKNTGIGRITFSGIAVTGPDAQSFNSFDHCGSAVESQASCTIDVEYRPGFGGSDSATMTISDSDVGSPQHVALTGRPFGYSVVPAGRSTSEARRVPTPTGTYAIGTRVLQTTDNARVDTLSATGELRALSLRFWYPANIGKCRAAAYASPAVWSVLSKLAGMRLPAVATNSCVDAPILAGFYPVVVFSHGLTGTFTDYTFLFEDLASRGYVVASVDHTYDASAVDLGDGRIARSRFGSYLTRVAPLDELEARQLEATRLGDIRFVLDELERLQNQPDSPFAGHLNVAAMAVAGHSFGGLTALEALHFDSRLRAAVALEGVMPDASFAATNRPVLLLDAGRRQWPEREQGVWQKLQGPRLAINLPGAGHLSPSDAVWYAKGTVATGSLSPEQAVSAIRDSVATFLDVQLRRRPQQALTQELLVAYPKLEITLPKEDVR